MGVASSSSITFSTQLSFPFWRWSSATSKKFSQSTKSSKYKTMKSLCCQISFLSFIRASCHQNLKRLKQNLKHPSNVKNSFLQGFSLYMLLTCGVFIEKETFYPTAFSV